MIRHEQRARAAADDIDHLGNRRVRAVGELIQTQFRVGLLRMERVIKERMSIQDPESASPSALINIRPVVAAMREFFGGSQLSQFMDQTNPLAELTHKRRLSALGPGGLSRDRAGFDVRDVHNSPLRAHLPDRDAGRSEHRPDRLAGDLRPINDYGFIETPYRRVLNTVDNTAEELVGHAAARERRGPGNGRDDRRRQAPASTRSWPRRSPRPSWRASRSRPYVSARSTTCRRTWKTTT